MARKKSFKKLNKIRNRIKLFKPLQNNYCGYRRTDIVISPPKSRNGMYIKVGRGYDLISFMQFINKIENTTITAKSIDNYIARGHVSRGWYIDSRTNQHKHRMYHPFSILEYLTAFHLSHGLWLPDYQNSPNEKKFSLARATSQDIFVGRLAFLKNGYAYKLHLDCEVYKILNFASYFFETDKYFRYYEPTNGFWAVPCNFDNDLFPCYEQAVKMLQEQFGTVENVEKYIAYCEMIYRSTFTYWYDKYIGDIVSNIPKSLPKFEGVGYS